MNFDAQDPKPAAQPRVPRSMVQRLEDAKLQPVILPLVGDFFYTGELHILFADTGVGKSILACQIADSVTRGLPVLGMKGNNMPMPTLLLDFELSDRQIEARYRDPESGVAHKFHDSFHSDTINFMELGEMYPMMRQDEALFMQIREYLTATQAQLLIIDNISYLSMQAAQDTQVALDLMKSLVELRKELNISILVLAHTPKIPCNRPITINDLAGSKNLSNFADSVSALGRSSINADMIYWKQVKASRSGLFVYDASNVISLKRGRITPAFLGFEWVETGPEYKHLRERVPGERAKLEEIALDMHKRGSSYAEIAKQTLGNASKKSTAYKMVQHALSKTASNHDQPIPFTTKEPNTQNIVNESDQMYRVNAANLLNDITGTDDVNGANDVNASLHLVQLKTE